MKLERATLAEQIAANLLQYIHDSGLHPGESLPSEADLVADFDVSRPVVREALKYLEGRGIIEVSSGRSAVLRPIDDEPLNNYFQLALIMHQQTLMELLEVRQGLEVQSAILAATRRSNDDLEQLTAITHAMREAMQDVEQFVELDACFHETVAAISQNKMLFHVIKSIRKTVKDVMFEVQIRRLDSITELEHVQRLHKNILDAITSGDPDAAANAMKTHFQEATIKLNDTK